MQRVFVSSVISGFGPFRLAARSAVTLLGLTPVMAEDFPAQSRSPEAACLGEVGGSDVYVGILGAEYGSHTETGRSATEEEFIEAGRLGLPRLVFRTTATLDADQAAFLDRIRAWGDGLLYGRFGTPEELKDEVVKALSAHTSRRPVFGREQALDELSRMLEAANWTADDAGIALALVPDAGRPLLGLDAIDDLTAKLPGLVRSVSALKTTDLQLVGKERGASVLAFGDRHEPSAFFQVEDDGRMVCLARLPSERRTDLVGAFYIDANQVERFLVEMISSFDTTLRYVDSRNLVGQVYLQGKLKGTQGKVFAPIPKEPVNSMNVPMHDLPDPMPFPSGPLQIARMDLRDPSRLAATLRGAIRRRFDEALIRRN